MKRTLQGWGALLTVATLLGCANDHTLTQKSTLQTPAPAPTSSSRVVQDICPIPPIGYEKIAGYDPGRVDPSQSPQSIAFMSPTLEENQPFYLGILQQPVKFCGIAKDNIVKVKFFASGAYLYETKQPVPAEPELPIGEASVKNGLWFFAHDFREVGVIDILAKGYDSNNQWVATTRKVSISLANPNPR